jgi:hypothetical protein
MDHIALDRGIETAAQIDALRKRPVRIARKSPQTDD